MQDQEEKPLLSYCPKCRFLILAAIFCIIPSKNILAHESYYYHSTLSIICNEKENTKHYQRFFKDGIEINFNFQEATERDLLQLYIEAAKQKCSTLALGADVFLYDRFYKKRMSKTDFRKTIRAFMDVANFVSRH